MSKNMNKNMEKIMFARPVNIYAACLRHRVVLHESPLYYEMHEESSKKIKKMQIITGKRDIVSDIENSFFDLKNHSRRQEVSYGQC